MRLVLPAVRSRVLKRRRRLHAVCACVVLLIAGVAPPGASAGRPLLTDDAAVVGARRLQLETWMYLADTLHEHAGAVAFGPTEWLEVAVSGSQCWEYDASGYGVRALIVQAKSLVRAPDAVPGPW